MQFIPHFFGYFYISNMGLHIVKKSKQDDEFGLLICFIKLPLLCCISGWSSQSTIHNRPDLFKLKLCLYFCLPCSIVSSSEQLRIWKKKLGALVPILQRSLTGFGSYHSRYKVSQSIYRQSDIPNLSIYAPFRYTLRYVEEARPFYIPGSTWKRC